MAVVVLQVGVTNGILGGISGLTNLKSLHIADAYRVTNIGLLFISTLTGGLSLATDDGCLSSNLSCSFNRPQAKGAFWRVSMPDLKLFSRTDIPRLLHTHQQTG
jgi:hypothetical protein